MTRGWGLQLLAIECVASQRHGPFASFGMWGALSGSDLKACGVTALRRATRDGEQVT